MQMKLLDGKLCAEHLIADISKKVAGYVETGLRKPHMTIILVGNHAPSESYVKSKIVSCEKAGFEGSLACKQLFLDHTGTGRCRAYDCGGPDDQYLDGVSE